MPTSEAPVVLGLYSAGDRFYQLKDAGLDTEAEVEFTGPFPVRVWLLAFDAGDGDGWGRSRIERSGEIIDDYEHDVSGSGETQAVLVEVKSKKALKRLEAVFELCESVPKPLYGGG